MPTSSTIKNLLPPITAKSGIKHQAIFQLVPILQRYLIMYHSIKKIIKSWKLTVIYFLVYILKICKVVVLAVMWCLKFGHLLKICHNIVKILEYTVFLCFSPFPPVPAATSHFLAGSFIPVKLLLYSLVLSVWLKECWTIGIFD